MITEEMIARINELARKSKAEGLTEKEKLEQAELRRAYIESVRANIRSQLDNCDVVNPDGTVLHLKEVREENLKNRKGS